MGVDLRRLKAVVDGLGYDFARFTIDDFAAYLSRRRGREIVMVPFSLPPNLYGAWLASVSIDYIFFDATAPEIHASYIKLHEFSHMLLGHDTLEVSADLQGLLASSLRPEEAPHSMLNLVGALCRDETLIHSPLSPVEQEAESLARVIQLRVFSYHRQAELTQERFHAVDQWAQGLGFE